MIFRFILFISILIVTSCQRARMETVGDEESAEKAALSSCALSSVDDADFLAQIDCPDGSSFRIPKAKDGVDGATGVAGSSCSVDSTPDGAFIDCEDGSQAFVKNGVDGHSCQVAAVDQYASLISCSDGSSSLIDLNSHVQSQQIEVIDPCGDDPGNFDEVIIRFGSGELIAYFEVGGTRFLTRLSPGSYQTTDQQQCHFSVDASGDIIDN